MCYFHGPMFCGTRSFQQFVLVSELNFLLHWRTLCVFLLSFSFSVRGSSTEMTFLST